ncbi:nitrate- and nitrite sensing domain-containing protein [Micromonospora sp. WMMD882]|uniref:nitrate- and nitrite sensing domain-containing protein n=1 Tax=Micromonospora sp. WMMD882 TaxID=3015151 RepID=UPI00248C4990|nr:nitrate- and nitrite sensing domain-containing protein [Micromonospora sp. WMMD882]WBB79195.1 nitrate- and nitrite sensing domain-containing protein [Micromonospora sp. WMMD882]
MSTAPTTLPESGQSNPDKRRRRLPRLRDARIRSKLALILVVPVAAVLALATVRLIAVGEGAYEANQARSLTALSVDLSALTQDLHRERMAAATYLAAPDAKPEPYNLHVRRTDQRVAQYTARRGEIGEVPSAVRDRLRIIDEHLATLNTTRQEVLDRRQMPVSAVVLRYGVVLADLVGYGDALAQLPGDGALADSRRAVAAFSRAKSSVAEEEAVAFTALAAGRVDQEQFSSFVATLTSQQEALLAFSLAAAPDQRSLVDGTVTGDAVVLADRVAADVSRSVGLNRPLVAADDATFAIGAVNDLMRWTEVELQDRLYAQTDQARTNVIRQAVIESLLVLLTLIAAITLAVVLARSLNHSLRRLREGALSVANHDLPEAVKRLQNMGNAGDGGVDEVVKEVRDPIKLTNKDEVGQVAQAFNVVHREAVRIAAEQAALRNSVSAMFLNLARRSQTLVDRMIGELDAIERGEEDPKRLAQLFELDHLATRMRRNDENLLVLAGADSAVPRRDDALLVDVLRAAQSEVELYNRIEFGTVDTDISVAAHAVNDVVRLVAELLDNATRFSPPTTTVVADGRRIRDYVLIQIEDRGLGLTDDQLDSLNRRLAAPSTVDVAAFRLMGLAVVSRLASRYNIRVELRRNVEGGTVAQVTLPNSTVVLPQTRGRDQALPPRQRQPLAVEQAPLTPSVSPFGEPSTGLGRTSTATLANDQWGVKTPTSAQWPASNDARDTGPTVNVGGPTTASPSLGGSLFTPVPPSSNTNGALAGTPTTAFPTLNPLPQRSPGTGGDLGTPTSSLPAGPVAGPTTPLAGPTTPLAGPTSPLVTPSGTPGVPAVRRPDEPAEAAPIFREMETAWFRSHGNDATAIFTRPQFEQEAAPTSGPTMANSGPALAAPTAQPPRLPGRTPGATVTQPPPPSYTPPPPAVTPDPVVTPAPTPAPEPVPTPVAHTMPPAPTAPPQPVATPTTPTPQAVPTPQPTATTGADAWRTAADEGWSRAVKAAEPAAGGQTRSGLPKRVPQAQLVPGGVEPTGGRDRSRRTPDEVRGLLSAYHRGVQRGRTAGATDLNSNSTKETSR